jgi:hypothetical protein
LEQIIGTAKSVAKSNGLGYSSIQAQSFLKLTHEHFKARISAKVTFPLSHLKKTKKAALRLSETHYRQNLVPIWVKNTTCGEYSENCLKGQGKNDIKNN